MIHLPTILVIFGATGDLARRKLIPALFQLHRRELLPDLFQVVAFSRKELSNQAFRAYVREIVGNSREGQSFARSFTYQPGFFDRKSGYDALASHLGMQDQEWRVCSNKLFYLAVPPHYYRTIFRLLAASGLTKPCSPEEGWTRVIVEKPFGRDLRTARALDQMLGELFREDQIYRMDHYLGKETVQNILAFRFSNSLFESSWNREAIERIQIQLLERSGIGGRGEFYDRVGALRDMGQNHLLQLLALVSMENPGRFDDVAIRARRAEVLNTLQPFTPKQAGPATIRGQYEGYRSAPGVKSDSGTETYFRIKTYLEVPRWRDVPFYLESGKGLAESRVEITVTFKHPTPCLCPNASRGEHYQNVLRYQVQPRERITTSFWVKKPGARMVIEEKDFSFDYKTAYAGTEFIDPYERLLLAAFEGDQTLFVSTAEIEASWKFIDPIVRAWQRNASPLAIYPPGDRKILEELLPVDRETPSAATALPSPEKTIGLLGLGKMGKNLALRLAERGWNVVAYDPKLTLEESQRIRLARNLSALAEHLPTPRLLWLMLPSGAVYETLTELTPFLGKGDIVIDGGNSFYEESSRRARELAKHGVHFLDVGVSGGPEGARNGASLMIGGEKKIFQKYEGLFRDLTVERGYAYVGTSGAGHFVKMIHNGIEYGMMQALAEGFSLLKQSGFKLDLESIAHVYDHGSVIESRLVEWLENAYRTYGEDLTTVSGSVAHTGEGEWTLATAKKLGVPAPVIQQAFRFRVQSRKRPSYTGKILTVLRNQFGGHGIK